MKGLVIGGGSIGSRHLRNLRSLGVSTLALVEPAAERQETLTAELGLAPFATLDAGLAWSPDFVVVATPTHLHAQQALSVARSGFPFFVEKPLSHSPALLADLADEVEHRGVISLVGCNMRFHPGPAKVKELLNRNAVGRVLFARLHGGFYLPQWRPSVDYRTNYAAREATGGGCLLDCIHEIDLARWYLGEVNEVSCMAGHFSSLEIETEDIASLTCRHQSGAISEIHLDYVQRTYERGCQIAGETGSLFWDFGEKCVRWYDAHQNCWHEFPPPSDWQLNQMYLDEMQHFLDCVREGRPTILPVRDAVAVVQIVFSAKVSAREGRLVTTKGEVTL